MNFVRSDIFQFDSHALVHSDVSMPPTRVASHWADLGSGTSAGGAPSYVNDAKAIVSVAYSLYCFTTVTLSPRARAESALTKRHSDAT
jgi:hypothetical protein